MVGLFMIASAIANAVGAALGGLLLDLDGLMGFAGWQWVFLVTGAPAVALAPYVLWKLPNGPAEATWLPQDQKSWLANVLSAEKGGVVDDHRGAWKAIFDPRVLLLAGLYIGMPLGAYGLSYWLPTIVKSFGVSNTVNGLVNVIPWLLVAVALWLVPRHAARHGASAWHIAGPVMLAAVALTLSVILPGAALKFAMLCVAAPAIFSAQPVFWSLPPSFLSGPRAAAGIAAINAIGNLGGFIAQNLVPLVRDATGSDLAPMLALAAVLVVTSVLIFHAMARLNRTRPGSSF
jgi:MFS family permease